MKIQLILIFLLCVGLAQAAYIPKEDVCKDRVDNEQFVTGCPHDYRDPNNWFVYYHFTVNESLATCIDGKVNYLNCTYTKLPWNHPNVQGEPTERFVQTSSVTTTTQETAVPEYSTITAALALVGASMTIFWKRPKENEKKKVKK